MLVFNFILSVKQSSILDISLFPAFSSSKNISLATSTFTNWNLFPFDSFHLFNSSTYLDGLFRILGGQSPRRNNDDQHDDNDNNHGNNDSIIANMSDIKPSDALTPSLGPINNNNNDSNNRNNENVLNINDDDDDFLI